MSEQKSGWSLKHRDNIEYGPFELEDLISAARAGNIAIDTMLRHSKHTRNQWIVATRVANIAQALSEAVPTSKTQQATTSHNSSTPAASNNPTSGTIPAHQPTPAGAAAAPPTPKSIFRRSRPRSANQSEAQTTKLSKNTEKSQRTDNQTPADNSSKQQDLSIRNWQEDGLLVPRTLPDAFFAFFDFKFRYFITPWIVKLLWFMGVTAAIIMVVRLGYDNLFSPELNAEIATEKATNTWQFEPLGGKPLLSFPAARYFVYVLGIFCGTLLLRVACEAFIVMFRVAGSLAEIKVLLKQKKQ
tara:strand:- start:4 stop:903 length:900 start_codon:yes stop_codon:yes gene_type:complete